MSWSAGFCANPEKSTSIPKGLLPTTPVTLSVNVPFCSSRFTSFTALTSISLPSTVFFPRSAFAFSMAWYTLSCLSRLKYFTMSAAFTSVVSSCLGGFCGVGVSPSSPPQAAKNTHTAAKKINFFIVNPVSKY